MSKLPLGIQLYTVRDALAKDFVGTLTAVAEMGYQGVEFAWIYGDLPPNELAALLKDLNLECCGLHADLEEILDPHSIQYQYVKAMNCRYITTSQPKAVEDGWNEMIRQLEQAGRMANEQGILFTYHNHTQEFVKIDGVYALDILYENTDPDLVRVELDACWTLKAGEDPASYIRNYAGRVPQVHLKDMNPFDQSVTEIGRGCLNVEGIYAAANEAGVQWMIVEQDHSQHSPLQSAHDSIEYLQKSNFI